MSCNRTCCKNCENKTIKKFNANDIMLYCNVKRRRVNSEGLCQWHIWEKQEIKPCNN